MPGLMRWISLLLSLGLSLIAGWAAQSRPLRHERQVQALQKGLQAQKHKALTYRFIVAGDNRDGNHVLRRLLQRAADFQPTLMLHSGDFVPLGRRDEYLELLQLLDQAPFPVFLALGNHDAWQGGDRWYRQWIGSPDSYFDYGPDRFVLLDNSGAQLRPAQLKWLDQVLAVPRRYRFVVMHYPPRNLIWFHAFSEGADELRRIVSRRHVNYVFMGHLHIYDQLILEGVRWLVSGGAGAPLYRMPLYFSPQGGAYPHFVMMEVSPSGLREQIIRLD